MKLRRWIATALSLLCLAAFGTAIAGETVLLDDIGVRYAPAEGETVLTRADMPEQALTALGLNAQTVSAAMERDQVYLIGIQPDGSQVSLRVSPKPNEIQANNACQMSASEKDAFLTLLAREGGYGSATWQTDGYALFASSVQTLAEGEPHYTDVSLATLYLGQVYAFHREIIGREPTQADTDLLTAAANRMLRLGASTQPADATTLTAPLTLPEIVLPTAEAQIQYTAQALPLTLDPVAATLGTTQCTLSGKTAPDGSLRYTVGGKSSSRIKAEADGSFRFTVQGLTGDAENVVTLTAFQGDQKTVATFTVTVDWQDTPLAVEQVSSVAEKTVTLQGLTLPGATVQLSRGKSAGRITVDENGAFSVTLRLNRIGENAFTLQALADGYHRTDFAFTVNREMTAEEAAQSLQKKARTVNYQKLSAKPSAYQGQTVSLRGTADALAYRNGVTSFVLTSEAGEHYEVLPGNLLAVRQGAQVALMGALTGELSAESGYPSLTLLAFAP